MKTLEETLAEKTAEITLIYKMELAVANMFPSYKTIVFPFPDKKFNSKYSLHIDFLNDRYDSWLQYTKEELKVLIAHILGELPATCTHQLIYPKNTPTESPFVLTFHNPCTSEGYVGITYISGDYGVNIKVPIFYYNPDLLEFGARNLTDSEYHYYPGVSRERLLKMHIRTTALRSAEKQRYYGGDIKCFITDPLQKEGFENVVLTGQAL